MTLCTVAPIVGCVVRQGPPPGTITYGQYAPPPVAPRVAAATPNARPTEAYRPSALRQHAMAPLFLPGGQNSQLVKFDVVDGQAVMEGDIVLGPTSQLAQRYGLPWSPPRNVRSAVTIADRSHLWPNGEIPFEIDGTVTASQRNNISSAITHINTNSPLKIRPRGGADRDFVTFHNSGPGNGCSSFVGRIGGSQQVEVAECGNGSVIHELLHAAGFFHEQSRGDRDNFIFIDVNEIDPAFRDQFEKRDSSGQDIGAYDYGSIMHYSSTAFSRSGRPTIIPKQPGVTIGQREGLSQLDRAAINELYGFSNGPTPPAPGPVPNVTPVPAPPGPTPPPSDGSFAGNYSSQRGNVACTQSGTTVNCTFPGGGMLCQANGAALDCAWSGGGSGRAAFQRQPSGVVSGTFGDFFSNNSRGAWDLTPAGAQSPGPAPSPPPGPAPAPAPGPAPAAAGLSGNYTSTRGPMSCTESGASFACTFQETPGSIGGRLDCQKDASGLQLACTWFSVFPPGSGRAAFSRTSTATRDFTGTFGQLSASSGAGTWDMKGQ
jgi:hypothetical protein